MAPAILLGLLTTAGIGLLAFGIFASDEAFISRQRNIEDIISDQQKSLFARFFTRTHLRQHIPVAIITGLVFGLGTGWPVAGLFGLYMGWSIPDVASGFTKGRRLLAEVESWEEWANHLLNLVLSGSGVATSIVASARYAPEPIRDLIEQATEDIETIGFLPAMDRLSENAKSPYADQLVLGLKVAYESGSKMSAVFKDMLEAQRNEVEIIRRAEAARKIANSQGLLSISITLILVFGIVLVNRGYLEPFDTLVGQLILGIVSGLFAGAITIIRKFSIVLVRPRLLAPAEPEDPTDKKKTKKKIEGATS